MDHNSSRKASRNKLINELKICSPNIWAPKLQRTIEYNFKKSPNFEKDFNYLIRLLISKQTT